MSHNSRFNRPVSDNLAVWTPTLFMVAAVVLLVVRVQTLAGYFTYIGGTTVADSAHFNEKGLWVVFAGGFVGTIALVITMYLDSKKHTHRRASAKAVWQGFCLWLFIFAASNFAAHYVALQQ